MSILAAHHALPDGPSCQPPCPQVFDEPHSRGAFQGAAAPVRLGEAPGDGGLEHLAAGVARLTALFLLLYPEAAAVPGWAGAQRQQGAAGREGAPPLGGGTPPPAGRHRGRS
jgi:hypothetical protein